MTECCYECDSDLCGTLTPDGIAWYCPWCDARMFVEHPVDLTPVDLAEVMARDARIRREMGYPPREEPPERDIRSS